MLRRFIILLIIALPALMSAQPWYAGNGVYQLNGIRFRLDPQVTLREAGNTHHDLSFSSSSQTYADSVIISYSHPSVDLRIRVSENRHFHVPAKQVELFAEYHDTLFIRDLAIKTNFTQQQPSYALRGPDAIFSGDPAQNKNLYPFTDRAIQYVFPETSLWLIGSNYEGCANLDWIAEDRVHLYDNALHFARRYNMNTGNFDALTDTMKRHAGDTNYYSFLIFEDEPVILKIKRWPADKDAALVITNDADGESPDRMRSVFFGSSDVTSPKYLTQGIIANNLKLTNTVFGASKAVLAPLWRELQNHGITIGYHTYSSYADIAENTYQNLVHDMTEFNIRTWIDHSWAVNPDCVCVEGWNPESQYFSLGAINDSNVDYIWLGDAQYTNPMNSFTEPWRLPHRLYEFDALTRPVWFYGRTMMGTWEATGTQYLSDMKHQLTPENLDQLLAENGLCVVYTHFFFTETSSLIPFYETLPNGTLQIRDEVNDRFAMLDYYQSYRGLWIDTLEEVFDRMLAVEELKIESSGYNDGSEGIGVTLRNASQLDIRDLSINHRDLDLRLDFLSAGTPLVFSTMESDPPTPNQHFLDIIAMYAQGRVQLKHRSSEPLPALNVDIYNIRGQKVCSQSFEKSAVNPSIPFFNQASGVYIARLKTPSGFSKSIKFSVVK